MTQPAARVGDPHTCPSGGGPILPTGCPTVLIGGLPAARVGDQAADTGTPDTIVKGEPTVLIGGQPAARMGDPTAHGGIIVAGCPTVLIGVDYQTVKIIECILKMCKNKDDRMLVDKTKHLKISTENAMTGKTWEYKGGGKWDFVGDWETTGRANPVTKEVTITRNMECSEVQRTIVHEVRHIDQPNLGITDPQQIEPDAFVYEEQWAIDRGLPGKLRKQLPDGTWVPDKEKINSKVATVYGDAHIVEVLPGGTDVELIDGTIVKAKPGQRVNRPYPADQDLEPYEIPPERLKCP